MHIDAIDGFRRVTQEGNGQFIVPHSNTGYMLSQEEFSIGKLVALLIGLFVVLALYAAALLNHYAILSIDETPLFLLTIVGGSIPALAISVVVALILVHLMYEWDFL